MLSWFLFIHKKYPENGPGQSNYFVEEINILFDSSTVANEVSDDLDNSRFLFGHLDHNISIVHQCEIYNFSGF